MTTPTISEAARRAAEQEIDEFEYRRRITQPRRPFEAGHYVQQALDSAHPASAEDHGYKVCFPYARIGDMTPALFKDGAYYYISAHPAPKKGETPETEPEKCEVCGGDEPCSHDFDKISWPTPAAPSLQSVAEGAAFYSQDDIETLITCDGRGVAEKRKSLAAIQARHIFCLAERDDRIKELNEVREAELVSCESRFAEFRKHAWEQQAALRTEIGRLEKELAAEKKSSRQAIDMGVANEVRLEALLTAREAETRDWIEWHGELQEKLQDAQAQIAERDERLGRLEEAREDALQALGEHPESETDLAQRIREIRQEGRDLFHDLTALRTRCEELERDKEQLPEDVRAFIEHVTLVLQQHADPDKAHERTQMFQWAYRLYVQYNVEQRAARKEGQP